MNQARQEIATELDRVLAAVLPKRIPSACFIDVPASPNVGDPVIFLGQLDYMRRAHPECRMWFIDRFNYVPHMEEWLEKTDLLLVQGGGNFGDIWRDAHAFRLRIMERFAHKTIVQLPQSVHFSDPAGIAETSRVLAMQRDFTLIARDDKSLAFATENLPCRTVLSPDMAFAMDPIARTAPVLDFLCLLRSDHEAKADHGAITDVLRQAGVTFAATDWLTEDAPDVLEHDARMIGRLRRRRLAMYLLRGASLRAREAYGRARLAYGSALLSRGRRVITDRLHAHVLCCLLGIPHFVLDSFDGKVSAMYRTWTHAFPQARFVEAPEMLAELIREDQPGTAPALP